jgi:NitT/TauT family transport system ATP-binding protein
LALDSKILLMDEPFGSLDEQTRKRLDSEVLRLWRLGRKTVLFITHSIEEAICLGTRVVLMSPSPGRILKQWDIDMDWPRDPSSPRFEDLKSDIIAHLRTCACAQTPKESTGGFITIDEEIA